jgi:hypothetical protein
MKLVWLYIAITVVGAVMAVIFRRPLRRAAGQRAGVWILVATGVAFLVLAAVAHDEVTALFGGVCLMMGAYQSEVLRLKTRIRELEAGARGHG